MTQTASPTRARPARPEPRARPSGSAPPHPLLAGARAGAVAALLGLLVVTVPVLVLWWGEDRSGTDVLDAVRSAAQLWLVAHGVGLETAGGRLRLAPLGLTVLPLWLCWRAGRTAAGRAGSSSPRDALRVGSAAAAAYASAAVTVAAAATGGGFRPVLWTALLAPALVGGLAASGGALSDIGRSLRDRLTERSFAALVTGAGAALLLLGAGALLVGTAVALDPDGAAEVAQASEPGAVGGLGLLLLGVSLLPNAAVWGACWLAGPGFTLGAGTAVGPFGVELGPVPALPLLVALPESAPATAVAVLLLGVPVLAGALATRLLHRCAAPTTWLRSLRDAAAVGLTSGALLGLLAALSGGALGGERLASVGPSPWRIALAVAAEVTAGAAVVVLLRRRRY